MLVGFLVGTNERCREERDQEQGVNSHGESPVVLDWPGDVAIRST